MKKLFYVMSLFLGLLISSSAFVACGDDDDNKDNGGGSQQGGGTTITNVTEKDILGTWYGVEESEDKINVFVVALYDGGRGYYVEFKAKAKNNWEPKQEESVEMTWIMKDGALTMTFQEGDQTATRRGDVLAKNADGTLKVKRYLDEGTDEIILKPIQNPQEAYNILYELVKNKQGDNNGSQPATTNLLVGTWSFGDATFIFTDKVLTIMQGNEQTFKGEYIYENGKVKYVEGDVVNTARVQLLYNNTTLVLITIPDNAADYSLDEVPVVLFRNGQAPEMSSDDIQGTWHWYMGGEAEDYIRAGVMISGNRIEIIITPWAERHVGTFTYSQGILHLNMTEFYSARSEDGQGWGEGGIDPTTLECDHWYPVSKDDIGDHLPETMLFVAGPKEAYGYIVGLPAVFVMK